MLHDITLSSSWMVLSTAMMKEFVIGIKPENLLLDQNFDLKIADFGYASLIERENQNGKLYTKLGTKAYMAPE